MYKNAASQKVAIYAHNILTDTSKTGDQANITADISLDGGASAPTNDVNPTQLDAANLPGVYVFDMTQAETNADLFVLVAQSTTAGVQIEPVIVYTTLLTPTKAAFLDIAISSRSTLTQAQILSDATPFAGASIAVILNRMGAFAGAGINTILGFLQAVMRNDVAVPTDVGGTYDTATDSLEAIGDTLISAAIFPAGGIAFTYTLTNSLTGAPIQGAEIWISTDSADPPVNIIWKGITDTFGIARNVNNQLPRLNAGTYYFWRKKPGFTFTDPDIEVVS